MFELLLEYLVAEYLEKQEKDRDLEPEILSSLKWTIWGFEEWVKDKLKESKNRKV